MNAAKADHLAEDLIHYNWLRFLRKQFERLLYVFASVAAPVPPHPPPPRAVRVRAASTAGISDRAAPPASTRRRSPSVSAAVDRWPHRPAHPTARSLPCTLPYHR